MTALDKRALYSLYDVLLAMACPDTYSRKVDATDYLELATAGEGRLRVKNIISGTLYTCYIQAIKTSLGDELKLRLDLPKVIISGETEGELLDIAVGDMMRVISQKHQHTPTPKVQNRGKSIYLLGIEGKEIAQAFHAIAG